MTIHRAKRNEAQPGLSESQDTNRKEGKTKTRTEQGNGAEEKKK